MIPLSHLWTYTGNYPAGSALWNGKQLGVAPSGTYWTPDTKPGAENFNWVFGNITNDLQNVRAAVLSISTQNWPTYIQLSNSVFGAGGTITQAAFMAACYDVFEGVHWFVAKGTFVSGGADVVTLWNTPDGGITWLRPSSNYVTPLGFQTGVTPDQYFCDVIADANTAGKIWVSLTDPSTATQTDFYSFSPGSSASWGTVSHHDVSAGTARVKMHTFAGANLFGIGTTTAADAYITKSTGSISGMSGLTATAFNFADNVLSYLLAMPVLTTTPTTYWTTPDATTWTAQAYSTEIQSGDQVFGIVYTQDAQGACWLMGVNRSSNAVFYRSATGVSGTWTLQSAPTQIPAGVTLVANGDALVMTTADTLPTCVSVDGGITWYVANEAYMNGNNATSTFYSPPSVVSDGQGFVLYNSLQARFSSYVGMPTLSLA